MAISLGIFTGVAAGRCIGAINGIGVSIFGVYPFIMTLGMASVGFGIALYMRGGTPVYSMLVESGDSFSFGYMLGIPAPVLVAVIADQARFRIMANLQGLTGLGCCNHTNESEKEMSVNINCDMGESFGLYKMGDDEGLMPYITEANVACGFHGSDLIHMRTTVDLAKRYDVKVGALKAFLDMAGVGLNHVKPHGALHGMAARQGHIAHAVRKAIQPCMATGTSKSSAG